MVNEFSEQCIFIQDFVEVVPIHGISLDWLKGHEHRDNKVHVCKKDTMVLGEDVFQLSNPFKPQCIRIFHHFPSFFHHFSSFSIIFPSKDP